MSFVDMLVEVGFDHAAAIELSQDESFKSRCQNRTATELTGRIVRISNIYSITITDTLKIISAFPPFAGYNHERVIKGIKAAYGFTDQQVSKIVSSSPSFAGLDHERVIKGIKAAYGFTDQQVSKIVSSSPSFAGLDHERVIKGIKAAYGFTDQQVSKIVSSFPSFAGYNHERVIKGIKAAYGFTDQQVSKIVSSFPSFAGLNHERVSQKLNRVGNLIGIDSEMIRAEILKNPALAGYSVRRYIAVIDVFRQLKREHDGISNDVMAHLWLRRSTLSPYVPDTDMLRVSQAVRRNEYHEEPKLMQVIRKDLSKLRSAST